MNIEDFRKLALSLPEATESAHMGHPDFRVRGKIFATIWPNEGWGMVKLTPNQQVVFVEAEPGIFVPVKGGWGRSTVQVLVVIFVATLIRSAFGFGEALVAVPLLALLMPVEVAAPLAVLLSITVAGVIVVQDWRKIHARSAGWLIFFTLFGIPCGLLVLTTMAEAAIKAILGVIIIAFSLYCLFSRRQFELKTDRLAWVFGFSAGVLGGAYGMNGPPLVVYGALRRWSPEHFRATLQGYFLPASLVGMAGYWFAGLWVPAVNRYYLLSLPPAIAAIFLGRIVNQRLDGSRFLRYIHCGLIAIGMVLLVQSLL